MGQTNTLPKVDAFSPEEVRRLEMRFQKLDLDRSGAISVGEFLSAVPELKENPLVKRVVDIFDSDLSGEVDFKGESIVSKTEKTKQLSSHDDDSDFKFCIIKNCCSSLSPSLSFGI